MKTTVHKIMIRWWDDVREWVAAVHESWGSLHRQKGLRPGITDPELTREQLISIFKAAAVEEPEDLERDLSNTRFEIMGPGMEDYYVYQKN